MEGFRLLIIYLSIIFILQSILQSDSGQLIQQNINSTNNKSIQKHPEKQRMVNQRQAHHSRFTHFTSSTTS